MSRPTLHAVATGDDRSDAYRALWNMEPDITAIDGLTDAIVLLRGTLDSCQGSRALNQVGWEIKRRLKAVSDAYATVFPSSVVNSERRCHD